MTDPVSRTTPPPPGEPFPVEEILAMCGEEAQRAFREQTAICERRAKRRAAVAWLWHETKAVMHIYFTPVIWIWRLCFGR